MKRRRMLKMKYPTVQKVDMCLEQARELYSEMGYRHIGGGCFAEVYQKGNYVLKFGYVNTTNYINYVRMIGLRSKNPHFPYITHVDIYDTAPNTVDSKPYYIVRMELLESMTGMNRFMDEDECEALKKHWAKYWKEKTGSTELFEVFSRDAMDENRYTPRTKELLEVRDVLGHLYRCYSASYDIGASVFTSNVMYRNGTPVFTDPIV